ncbi:MAG: 50S ribosomal protein L9 [Bacillota bacterium]|nr:50S ribosomal protein L9 [Bacillota bacterium]
MKVVLLKDVPNLGRRGEVVNVAEGYARNYLLPRRLAEPASEGRMQEIAHNIDLKAKKEERAAAQARAVAARLTGRAVKVAVRAGEGGKLFGSVQTRDIAAAVASQLGLKVDRKKFEIKEPVRALGRYTVLARLHPGVQAEFTVEVVNSGA